MTTYAVARIEEILSYIRARLSDRVWVRNNTQEQEGTKKRYWYFAFTGELTDALREGLTHYFTEQGWGTVVVRTYAEHCNGKGGFMIYLFVDKGVEVPTARAGENEEALS